MAEGLVADAVVVICSRPESRRIQEKCFRRIAGVTALEHLVRRVMQTNLPIIVAVPYEMAAEYRKRVPILGEVRIIEGDPDNPLHRMAHAVKVYGETFGLPKYTVRVTHDDILIDAQTVRDLLDEVEKQDAGYGITSQIAEGMGVEVIHNANLFQAERYNQQAVEHISYFVRGEGMPNPKVLDMVPREGVRRPYRLSMDYPEDVTVLQAVLSKLGPRAENDAICSYLDRHSYILRHNQLPEVSVYTCAHNAARWVGPTILSVGRAAEQVIVDDCSTDGTLEQILAWSPVGAKVVSNAINVGLASSSNIALKACRGRYLMRLDADDKLLPWAIEKMVAKIKETKAAIVYANYDTVDEEETRIESNVDAKIHHHAGCALMDSRLINEIKFKEGLRHWDSLELFQRVSARFPIAYVDEPLWLYRVRGDSMSRTNLKERERCKP